MSSPCLMSVDVGTQSAKITIFDLDGQIISQGLKKLRNIEVPAPSLAIHPDDDVWDATQIAMTEAMENYRQTGRSTADIKAIGLCVIRCCRSLVKANGELAYPLIGWMDKRMNKPYQNDGEYQDVGYVSTSSGYITARLTGEFKDTCANYIGWWPMDDEKFDWSRDPKEWENCKLSRNQVMDVVKPSELLGYLKDDLAKRYGLPQKLPVVATAHDKAVEALGSGSLEAGTILISLGTYIGALTQGDKIVKDAKDFWSFQADMPFRYIYECWGVRLGMWTISWFRDQFGQATLAEATDKNMSLEDLLSLEAEKVPAGSDGLITIHDWAAPPHAEFRKGAMIGFDTRHTRAHMYRSLLEGVAFTLKNHVDKMSDELKVPTRELVVSGGGANSSLFVQILSDVFGVPARVNKMRGAAAIGCAINAGIYLDLFKSYEEGVERMVKLEKVYQPSSKNHDFYHQLNESVYKRAQSHLDPLLERLSPLVD